MLFTTSLRRFFSTAFGHHPFVVWAPLAIGFGIGLYFALPVEPSGWVGIQAMTGLAALFALLHRRMPRTNRLIILLFLAALGFASAQWRTASIAAPVLGEELRNRAITATLEEILIAEDKTRLVLSDVTIDALDAAKTPHKIRVTVRSLPDDLNMGDRLRLTATLMPPPAPSQPGGYDVSRHFYFQQIGALGYALRPPEIIVHAQASGFTLWLTELRHTIGNDMRARIGGAAGAIAAAMTVGEQTAIPDDAAEALRDSGLTHIISISGVHLSLAAGLMFVGVRLLLLLIPHAHARWPIKKIAAGAALLSSFAYLLLAGSPVPAQRSFIMVAFVLLAVMVDRRGISLHALAWAAVFILLIFPETMSGASFQMSFAATLAIVTLYEAKGKYLHGQGGWRRKTLWYFLAIMATSLAATAATAPFVLYHFNRFSLVGVAANMAVMPLASILIMPGIMLSLLLMPFGLQGLGYAVLDVGVGGMVTAAHWAAALPYASLLLPAPLTIGFALAIGGMLWTALARGNARTIGVVCVALGLSTAALRTPPDVLIGDDGRQVMARAENGAWVMLKGAARAYTAQNWLRSLATDATVKDKDTPIAMCDKMMCEYTRNGHTIRVVKTKQDISTAVATACATPASALVAWWYISADECPNIPLLVDRRALLSGGAHALWLDKAAIRLQPVFQSGASRRPWQTPVPYISPRFSK